MRSPPERSTRMAIPGYVASNALAMRSATGRSTAVYQMTLPSFLAASMSSWVTWAGGGEPAQARQSINVRHTGATVRPERTWRRGMLRPDMSRFPPWHFGNDWPFSAADAAFHRRPAKQRVRLRDPLCARLAGHAQHDQLAQAATARQGPASRCSQAI